MSEYNAQEMLIRMLMQDIQAYARECYTSPARGLGGWTYDAWASSPKGKAFSAQMKMLAQTRFDEEGNQEQPLTSFKNSRVDALTEIYKRNALTEMSKRDAFATSNPAPERTLSYGGRAGFIFKAVKFLLKFSILRYTRPHGQADELVDLLNDPEMNRE